VESLHLAGSVVNQGGPEACEVAQSSDWWRRHEAGPNESVLDKLGNPSRVGDIFSELEGLRTSINNLLSMRRW
jgi:hypothetical protein